MKYLIYIFIVLAISCDIVDSPENTPDNPYDKDNPDYEKPAATIIEGPGNGDTIGQSTVNFKWNGNTIANEYRYNFNNSNWSPWTDDTTAQFSYLNEEKYSFEIVARADDSLKTIGDTTSLEFVVDAVDGPSLMFYPRYKSIPLSNTAIVEIKAEEVEGIMGAEINISYEPSSVEIDTIYLGNYIENTYPNIIFFHENDSVNGELNAILVTIGERESILSGSSTILNFIVQGRSSGTTQINFIDSCKFRTPQNQNIRIKEKTKLILEIE